MKIQVHITIQSDEGKAEVVHEVAHLERGSLRPDTLGLSLAEARAILAGLEQTMAEGQAAEFVAQAQRCPSRGQLRACKGHHPIVFRTPFGKLKLDSPQLYCCPCESPTLKSFSPLAQLLPERTSPELAYLETKFAALVSYGLSVKLLHEILPLGQGLSTTTVRRRVRQTAGRLESERCSRQEDIVGRDRPEEARDALPEPMIPLVVGLDGVYVHAKDQRSRTEGWFEVIVGKRFATEDQASPCFGFVSCYDPEPKGRLAEWLNGQGLQANQAITFLSDGGDTVRELPMGLHPKSEHLLDTVPRYDAADRHEPLGPGRVSGGLPDLEEMLEHVKWNLWHGKVDRALEIVDELVYALDVEDASPKHRKLLKAVQALEVYLTNNRAFVPNYGARYRKGQVISTAFVESAVNQVGEPMVCEETADAVDPGGRAPSAANPHRGAKRRLERHTARADAPAETTSPY